MQSTTLQTVATKASSDLDTLNHLNLEYIRSVEESDARWFDTHLAPDFMNSNPDGSLVDRQGFLNQIERGAGVSDIKAQDVIIRIMGDLAIIHAATTCKTVTGSLKGRYTDIWSRREQSWLCVAAQVTRF
jgi:ketosteroid isomerase-like protein